MGVRVRYAAALFALFALAACSGGAAGSRQSPIAAALPPISTPAPGGPVTYLASAGSDAVSGTLAAGTSKALVAVISGNAQETGFDPDTLQVAASSQTSSADRTRSAHRAAKTRVPAEAFAADDRVLLASLHRTANGVSRTIVPAAAVRAPSIGTAQSLWVQQGTLGGPRVNVRVPATLLAQTAHANIWIDDSLAFSQSTLAQIGADFENAYASDTSHFASPDYPASAPARSVQYSVCNAGGASTGSAPAYISEPADRRVDLMIVNASNLGGLGGYFTGANLMTQGALNCLNHGSSTYESNEAPFIFVGWFASAGTTYELQEDLVRGTAHELQHLINFVNHSILPPAASSASFDGNESIYINEGLSMLAQDFAVSRMYSSQGVQYDVDDAMHRAGEYLADPPAYSLSAFYGTDGYNCSDGCYGVGYLFQRYLYDRFGGDVYARAVETGGRTGSDNLRASTGEDAQSLFRDFALALAAQTLGISDADPRFRLGSLNLLGTYADQFGSAITLSGVSAQPIGGANVQVRPPVGGFAFVSMGGAASAQSVRITDDNPAAGFTLEGGLAQR